MADIYSRPEIVEKIKAIDARIESAESALSYTIDTGQGRQTVQRQQLDQLYNSREYWLEKLESMRGGGIIAMEFRRR